MSPKGHQIGKQKWTFSY